MEWTRLSINPYDKEASEKWDQITREWNTPPARAIAAAPRPPSRAEHDDFDAAMGSIGA